MALSPAEWPGGLAYFGVFLAALIEGEIFFVAAATLVGQGLLNPFGVVVAGTLGAAAGDQIPFYLLRCHLRSWLDRIPAVRRVSGTLIAHVRRRRALLPFLIRFSPGLRIAISSACAYADVPPLIFSTCSVLGALVWATCIVVVVGWLGPQWMAQLGISKWWAALVPAFLFLFMLKTVAWSKRRHDDDSSGEPEGGQGAP